MNKKIQLSILITFFVFGINMMSFAQFSSIKVNALGLATTNINVGVDLEVNKNTTINIPISVNPFTFGDTKIQYVAIQPGVRFWRYQNYIGHFMGAYTTAAIFDTNYKGSYSEGVLVGLGLSYGYSIMLSKRLNLEFEVGGSVVYAKYNHGDMDIGIFDDELIVHYNRVMLVPSKACVSFSYLF